MIYIYINFFMSLQAKNPELYKFFDSILTEVFGQENVDEKLREQMFPEMEEQFQIFINEKYLENMSPEAGQKYLQLLQSQPNLHEVQEFLENNIENLQTVIQNAAADFANMYLEASQE